MLKKENLLRFISHPLLAISVMLCGAIAWRIWRNESPGVMFIFLLFCMVGYMPFIALTLEGRGLPKIEASLLLMPAIFLCTFVISCFWQHSVEDKVIVGMVTEYAALWVLHGVLLGTYFGQKRRLAEYSTKKIIAHAAVLILAPALFKAREILPFFFCVILMGCCFALSMWLSIQLWSRCFQGKGGNENVSRTWLVCWNAYCLLPATLVWVEGIEKQYIAICAMLIVCFFGSKLVDAMRGKVALGHNQFYASPNKGKEER